MTRYGIHPVNEVCRIQQYRTSQEDAPLRVRTKDVALCDEIFREVKVLGCFSYLHDTESYYESLSSEAFHA